MSETERSRLSVSEFTLLERGSSSEISGRFLWEFNSAEVSAIKDSITEFSVYDEEMNCVFTIHAVLPPNYSADRTYPMFVFTDGVWRFGNFPSLNKMMADGEIGDVILVSIGYGFDVDGTDNAVRASFFERRNTEFLAFITDNLMPYLNESYNIDFAHSGLYGHSLGGVFAHYAAFNSDKFLNQPFKRYIIGSPAFGAVKYFEAESCIAGYRDEYGYFVRNGTFDKEIFICGGSDEDDELDFDGDKILPGIANFSDRMKEHGVTAVTVKIYENFGHWQYLPDMLKEYFRNTYNS